MSSILKSKTNLHLWANYYAKHDKIVVPIATLSKKPSMGADWQQNTDNDKSLTYLHENSNLGILLTNNYCDVDLDCDDAIEIAPYFLPPTSTFGRESAPSSHWVYNITFNPNEENLKWYSKSVMPPTVDGVIGTVAEFRYGNGQTVHPPSIHESGEAIVWDGNNNDPLNPNSITTISAHQLKRQFYKMCAMVMLKHVMFRGHLHAATVMIVGALYHLGWDLDEVEEFIGILIDVTGMTDEQDRYKAVYDTFTKGDNNQSNIGGFNELQHIFDESSLDGQTIVRYLRRCLEPTGLGDRKPQTPADVFAKLGNKLGDLVEQPAVQTIDTTPPDFSTTTSTAPDYIPDNTPPAGINTAAMAAVEPLDQMDMEHASLDWLAPHTAPREYYPLFNNLLPRDQVGFVFGESGAYKSYLVMDLVMSSIYLDEWAGHQVAANKKSTLWVAGEGKHETPDRIDAWLQENDVSRGTPASNRDGENIGLKVYNNSLELHTELFDNSGANTSFDVFEEYLKRNQDEFDLVVLDTFSSLFSGNDNDRSDVVRVLNRLQAMSRRYHMTFLIVHHKNKGGKDYRGSGAITADSDFNMDISHELDLAENEVAKPDSDKTGRIVFHNTQQKTQASGSSKLYFKPRVVPLAGFISGFGEQVTQVVMDLEVGMDALPKPKRKYTKPADRVGFEGIRTKQQRDFYHDAVTVMKDIGGGGIETLDYYKAYESYRRNTQRIKGTKLKHQFVESLNRLINLQCITSKLDNNTGLTVYYLGEPRYLEGGNCNDIKEEKPVFLGENDPIFF